MGRKLRTDDPIHQPGEAIPRILNRAIGSHFSATSFPYRLATFTGSSMSLQKDG